MKRKRVRAQYCSGLALSCHTCIVKISERNADNSQNIARASHLPGLYERLLAFVACGVPS